MGQGEGQASNWRKGSGVKHGGIGHMLAWRSMQVKINIRTEENLTPSDPEY